MDADFLNSFNDPQRSAVLHRHGPMVVFAGAGSGKTRVIAGRIAMLLNEGVKPWEILAVTFTNKAAGEMRQRVERINPDGRRCHIGTFHAICARWLREFAAHLGFRSDFLIYDDGDMTSLLKKIVKEGFPKEDVGPIVADAKSLINRAKMRGFLPQQTEEILQAEPYAKSNGLISIYRTYQEKLAQCQAMDFGDLILNILLLLRRNKQVRKTMQNRYRYILVDEFQDTNQSQLELVRTLSEEHQNIFVVGDDDQSIYSWRGAVPGNIINFKLFFPSTKTVLLTQNYRSTANIVAAASAVISRNRVRADKKLFSQNAAGAKIDFHFESDGEMEAWSVVDRIKSELVTYHYSDFAIFYRTNAQSRLVEEALRRENMPYQIYGAVKFYERLEVKDILAYLRLLVNPDDDVSLKRIINVPARGIGNKAILEIETQANYRQTSMMETIRQLVAESTPKLAVKLSIFLTIYDELFDRLQRQPEEIIEQILDLTEYKVYLQKKFPDQYEDKTENVLELANGCFSFFEDKEGATLSQWLQEITLVREDDTANEEMQGVSVMTLHAAKGLEYKRVFIVGVEEGLLPHKSNMEDREMLEEERRLMYVGMTRAMEKLSLYSARFRTIFGTSMSNDPSRFIEEIPNDLLECAGRDRVSCDEDEITYDYDDIVPSLNGASMTPGSSVRHPSYGRGTLTEIIDNYGKPKAIVDFIEFGERKVTLSHLTALAQR